MNKTLLALGLVGVLTLQGCTGKAPVPTKEVKPKAPTQTSQPAELTKLTTISFKSAGMEMSNYNQDLQVSPDGKYLAFSGYTFVEGSYKTITRLYLLDLATQKPKELAQTEYAQVLAWQPEGKGILFTDGEELKYYDLEQQKSITISEPRSLYGAFSPAGDQIVYSVFDSGLWLYDFKDNSRTQLTKEREAWYPIWYPDGKQVLYFKDLDVQLGDGAGSLQGLAKLDVATKKVTRLVAEEEGKYRSLEWIVPGESAYILGGWDDGFFKNLLDLKAGKVVDLGEDTDMTDVPQAIAASELGQLWDVKGNSLKVVDQTGKTVSSFVLAEQLSTKVNGLAIAPKADKFIYTMGEPNNYGYVESSQVYVAKSDNGQIGQSRALDLPAANYVSPLWLPNGKAVVVLEAPVEQAQGGEFKLHLVPIE